MNDYNFKLLNPNDRTPQRRDALAQRSLPETLSSHREAAKHYQADDELIDAINVALAVGAPLLLTGEPGTGKTQVAHFLAWYFELNTEEQPYTLSVRSTTTADDLLYHFDAVAYLHAANDPKQRDQELNRAEFIKPGPLWKAYECEGPAVVLIDEVDKAPRDFPNDLLEVLSQHEFHVRELERTIEHNGPPPVVVITSNSERRLPEPFLRRCIFHHITFTEDLVRRAVQARIGDFPNLSEELREAAIQRFLEIRGRDVRKKPATAELLVWLTVLAARDDITLEHIRDESLATLKGLSALIKDRDDLALLG